MKTAGDVPTNFEEYIAPFPPKVRAILKRVRTTILKAAPGATEKISYRMPSFVLDGVVAYVGGFKEHVGLYPPVRDAKLKREAVPYAGEKGNLRFRYDEPIPYDLIGRIVESRVTEQQSRAATKRATKRASKK
jgi:uncharacterized protein YdhG (YjbR/CyaY superfamily)